MPKVIRGTKDANGTTIIQGGKQGMRQFRCPSCQGLAAETTLANGKKAYVCRCGAMYNIKSL